VSGAELTLVVGASGLLGTEIIRQLTATGRSVRALVRPGTSPDKRAAITATGAGLCDADLKDRGSLGRACEGVTAIISTASATLSRQDGDSIESVDEQGQLELVEAAEQHGVKRFVFVSFPPVAADFALQRAKRKVEQRLQDGKLQFTVLQPCFFPEVWFTPAVGFDPVAGRARVFGEGAGAVSWVSLHDVVRFAVAASEDSRFADKTLPIGGPDPLTQIQVVRIFEEAGSPGFALDHVPEAMLAGGLTHASNAIEEAFAALMLTVCRGLVVDPRPALELLPGRLTTVRDHAARVVKSRTEGVTSG
jgi:uncharacterized protein YbjT (DUF2867 family)